MSDEPLSPSQIGDNIFQYPITERCKLQCGKDQDVFFLRVMLDSKPVWERNNGKDVLAVSSLKKDLIEFLVDLEIVPNLKVAKKTISGIYAYFNPLLSRLMNVTSVTTVTSVTSIGGQAELSSLIFSDTTPIIPTQISCGNGIINDQYYFGTMWPQKKPVFDKAGKYQGEETETELILVFDNSYVTKLDSQFKNTHNITYRNDKLSINQDRWNFKKIKEYMTEKDLYKTWSAKQVYDALEAQFRKHISFNEDAHYSILPLWVMGTYLTPVFNAFPYINLWGFKNTGKTKVMELSKHLCLNSTMLANTSTAALFRIIEQDNPTLFLDEVENLFDEKNKSEETSEIVSILNAGWMKGSRVSRVEKINDKQEIVKFNVYCPKMMGSIKGIKGALESRSINIVMVRSADGKISDTWPREDDKEIIKIRNELYPFILNNWKEIKLLYDEDGDFSLKKEFALSNRDWQVWKPLLCIAKLISDDLYNKVGKWAVESISRGSEDDDGENWDDKIIECLLELVKDESPKEYHVKELKSLVDKEFIERVIVDAQGNESPIYQKARPSATYVGRLLNKIGLNKYRRRGKKVFYVFSKSQLLSCLRVSQVGTVVTDVTVVTPSLRVNQVPQETSTIEPSLPVEDLVEDIKK